MNNDSKKKSRLKKYLINNRDKIKRDIRDIEWYSLGIFAGYLVFGKSIDRLAGMILGVEKSKT